MTSPFPCFLPWQRASLTAFFILVLSGALFAQDWKSVYEPMEIRSLYLQVDPTDWTRVVNDQPLEGQPELQERAAAWFNEEGEAPILVEIRRKGATDPVLTSGGLTKVSLKIDINALVAGQRWNSLRKLSLELGGTAGPLDEGFAWQVHRRASEAGFYGYDSANAAWVKLYVNGVYHGVFTSTEQRDEQFLMNHDLYSPTNTWLYKVDGGQSLDVGIGDSPTFQHLDFVPFQGNGGGGGPNLEIDLPQWIDMDSMLTVGACNAYLENGDGLFKRNGKNSFAVDFNPPNQRLRRYFPWDLDAAIKQGSENIYGNFFRNEIIDEPWFQRVYEHILRELIEGPLSEASLHAFLSELEVVLAPELAADPFINSGAGDFAAMRSWVTARNANVLGQLALPFVARPVFSQPGGEVVSGFGLAMTASAGQIYYTLDGSDPRSPGGGVAPSAQLYTAPAVIDRTRRVVARALDGGNWSGLATEATFNIASYGTALRITEIMYNPRDDEPADLVDNDAYEFIELRNTGATPLDISDFYLDGIGYSFPANTIVPSGAFLVLVRDAAAFAERYPSVAIDGIYLLKLSNGGEKLRLRNTEGSTLLSVEYNDSPPWVLSPDGFGHSLVNINVDGDPDDAFNWRASTNVHGSPGAADPAAGYAVGLELNEVLSNAAPPFEGAIEILNRGDTTADLSGWFLSDEARDLTGSIDAALLKKYRIPMGVTVSVNGFAVFYENAFQALNPDVPFSLSPFGGRVYLSSADAAGELTGQIIALDYPAMESNVSYGRVQTSEGFENAPLESISFGVSAPASLSEFRNGAGAPNSAGRVGPVVLSEIMYNPAAPGAEFVELHNISTSAVDISGWDIDGIGGFAFPAGTVLPVGGFAIVLDVAHTTAADFRLAEGVPSEVPIFENLLDLGNAGEALRLEKPNPDPLGPDLLVERVRYNDRSPWPTEADGGGPSLERFVLTGYGNEPLHWRAAVYGGSPGRAGDFAEGVAIAQNSSWDYKATASALTDGWRDLGYNATSWENGAGSLGYGEPFITTTIPFGPDALNRFPTTYFRKVFVVNDAPADITALTLSMLFDDGVVVYLNGKEVARSGLPAGAVLYSTLASDTEASTYQEIDLLAVKDCLVQGDNILAAEVHQSGAASNDLVWDASLLYSVGAPVDADGDGMPDAWELANGLDPGSSADAGLDGDADGQSNLSEYLSGTDPNDPESVLQIDGLDFSSEGRSRIGWESVAGKNYRILYSPDLDSWFGFGALGDITATGFASEFTDPTLPAATRRFYRLEVLPTP